MSALRGKRHCQSCRLRRPEWVFRCPECGASRTPRQALTTVDDRSWSEDHLYYSGKLSRWVSLGIIFGLHLYVGLLVIFAFTSVILNIVASSSGVLQVFSLPVRLLLFKTAEDTHLPVIDLVLHGVKTGLIGLVFAAAMDVVSRAVLHRYVAGFFGALLIYGALLFFYGLGSVVSLFVLPVGILGLYLTLMGYSAIDFSHGLTDELRCMYHDFLIRASKAVASYS